MRACFCGHCGAYDSKSGIQQKIENAVMALCKEGVKEFFCALYSEYDYACQNAVLNFQLKEPDVKLVWVMAKNKPTKQEQDEFIKEHNIELVYPPIESNTHSLSVLKRNQWMVDHSDIVMACASQELVNNSKTLLYAKSQHKQIITI